MKIKLPPILGLLACGPLVLGCLSASAAPALSYPWQTPSPEPYQAVSFADEDEAEGDLALEPQATAEAPMPPANGGGDCDECFGAGCNVCCPPQRFWYAGTEAVFLSPELRYADVSFSAVNLLNGATSVYRNDAGTVENNLYASPRLWVGVQGPCWGLVGRFWELQASEMAFDPLSTGFGSIFQDRLDVYTADLEVVRRFCRQDWKWDLGFGVRHAGFDHDTTATPLNNFAAGGVTLLGTQLASSQFSGTGLTLGLTGRRPIHRGCASTLHLFWTFRGSVLWGDVDNWAEQTVTIGSGSGSITVSEMAESTLEDDLFIGEVQLGLQWEYCLQCVPATAFFRTAFEYQGWEGNGGISQINTFIDGAPLTRSFSTTSSSDATMDLVGFSIGTGFTW